MMTPLNNSHCFLIVTAADEKYTRTLAQLLMSLERHLPLAEKIVYDLGISPQSMAWLKAYFPTTEFRVFKFNLYPSHFTQLHTCAWKPAILTDFVEQQKRVLWLDAATIVRSTRLVSTANMHLARKGYFALTSQSSLSTWCHPATTEAMKAPAEILTELIVPAGVLGFDGQNPQIRKLVSEWKQFCLRERIICPFGASRQNHRFDQAVLNNLLYKKIRENLLEPPCAGEIDISSISPVTYLSTRNFVANHFPLWSDPILRLKHRIVKASDRFVLKLRHIHRTTLSGFHRLAQEKFSIIARTGSVNRRLRSPANQYWADPFIFRGKNLNWIFFEKYEATTAKGVISALALNDSGDIIEPEKTILSERWHLSYPHIWQSGKRTFMLPEASAARTVDLYEAVDFPHTWVLRRRLLYGIDAADTTLLQTQGRYWLFCAVRVSPGSPGRALHIYSSKSLFKGKWLPHPINAENRYADLPFSSGRGAGRIFREGKTWIRPMQWSTDFYGQGMRFMKIRRLSMLHYHEEEATRSSEWHVYTHAHHVDFCGRVTVYDYRTRTGFLRKRAPKL
jgi:hypothetical protein